MAETFTYQFPLEAHTVFITMTPRDSYGPRNRERFYAHTESQLESHHQELADDLAAFKAKGNINAYNFALANIENSVDDIRRTLNVLLFIHGYDTKWDITRRLERNTNPGRGSSSPSKTGRSSKDLYVGDSFE